MKMQEAMRISIESIYSESELKLFISFILQFKLNLKIFRLPGRLGLPLSEFFHRQEATIPDQKNKILSCILALVLLLSNP